MAIDQDVSSPAAKYAEWWKRTHPTKPPTPPIDDRYPPCTCARYGEFRKCPKCGGQYVHSSVH